ncbi:MAG: EamA family transporter [Tissierellia bacterium]|nr:EamA family transporter [Tissierellia bacterium]
MNQLMGMIYTMISAFVFGFTPILVNITFDHGNNPVMMAFFRGFLVLPVLFISLNSRRVSLKVDRKQGVQLFILSVIGGGLTTVVLYSSYQYMSVGGATTLHFIYPAIVTFIGILFFKERSNLLKLAALILSMIGVFILADFRSGTSLKGIFLATISGFTYAFYIIYMDRSGLKNMDSIKVTFYNCLMNSVFLTIYGMISGDFTLKLPPIVWGISFFVAVVTAILGVAFLQMGIMIVGPSTASILSTLEPITSVILGVFILHESADMKKIIACTLIFLSVILLSYGTKLEERKLRQVDS